DPARARRGVAALACLAHGAAGAVGVPFTGLAAAHEPVTAHHGSLRADASLAGRARIAAGEPRLAALLAGIDAAVAAVRELELVGADVDPGPDRARVAVQIRRGRARAGARIDGRAGREQVEVRPGRHEILGRRGEEGVRVVAERLPAREPEYVVSLVDAEAVDDGVVVRDQTRPARGVHGDRAMGGMEVVEDVVAHHVPGGARVDVDAPA